MTTDDPVSALLVAVAALVVQLVEWLVVWLVVRLVAGRWSLVVLVAGR